MGNIGELSIAMFDSRMVFFPYKAKPGFIAIFMTHDVIPDKNMWKKSDQIVEDMVKTRQPLGLKLGLMGLPHPDQSYPATTEGLTNPNMPMAYGL